MDSPSLPYVGGTHRIEDFGRPAGQVDDGPSGLEPSPLGEFGIPLMCSAKSLDSIRVDPKWPVTEGDCVARSFAPTKAAIKLHTLLELPALANAARYKICWQAKLLVKWIKKHLRIKKFSGTWENAAEDADLVCRVRLRAHRHRQEETSTRRLARHVATEPVRLGLREIPAIKLLARGDIRVTFGEQPDGNSLILPVG